MKLLIILFEWFPLKGKDKRDQDLRLSDQLEREIERKLIDNDRHYY